MKKLTRTLLNYENLANGPLFKIIFSIIHTERCLGLSKSNLFEKKSPYRLKKTSIQYCLNSEKRISI